jgi:hypothetical protein
MPGIPYHKAHREATAEGVIVECAEIASFGLTRMAFDRMIRASPDPYLNPACTA